MAAGSCCAGPGRRAAGEAGTRASVGLGFKPESDSRWKTRPTGGARLSAREKGEERAESPWAGWARPCGGEKKRKGQLGRAVREEGREGKGQAGPRGEKEREGKREREREDGPGQVEKKKEREKEMHSNAFEFEFKI
jgi:hypothetical protein